MFKHLIATCSPTEMVEVLEAYTQTDDTAIVEIAIQTEETNVHYVGFHIIHMGFNLYYYNIICIKNIFKSLYHVSHGDSWSIRAKFDMFTHHFNLKKKTSQI